MTDREYLNSILVDDVDGHLKLEKAMTKITPHQRRLVELFIYERLTLKESASRIACSIKYTKNMLTVALSNLKRQLLTI